MTLRCENCGCTDMVLDWDNGADYPNTRVEKYECQDCGNKQTVTLTA